MVFSEAAADLERRFGIPGRARVVPGHGGLAKVVVSTPDGDGEMYLHGGQVTSWVPKGTGEVLYVGPKALWQDGRAVRGGVPVCFPWFGDKANDPAAPAHGFVRSKAWQLESIESWAGDVAVSMCTESGEDTRKWWPFDFRLVCRATFGAQLRLELIVANTGPSFFSFEEALHAYFLVGDAASASLQGLDATRFIDKTDRHVEKEQRGAVQLHSETDRVYLNTQRGIELSAPTLHRRVTVQKENSLTTVVWNPWAEKARALGDLSADEWKDFVCIETSNVGPHAVHLGSGQRHSMAALIRVGP